MRIRKEVYLVLAVIVILTLFIVFRPKAEKKVLSTNLNGIEIYTDKTDGYIKFSDNDRVALSNPPGIFLIANGSVVKNTEIKAFDGMSMLPLEKLAEIVGAEVKVSEKNGDEFNLLKDKTKVTFRLNDQNFENGGKTEFLNAKPIRDGRTVYVPLKDFFQLYGYNVVYTNGEKVKVDEYPVIPLYQQIMVSNYSDMKKTLTKEEAIKIVQDQLKIAYKTRFKEKYKDPDENVDRMNPNEKDEWRLKINEGLKIKAENDRYFIIPVVWDFMVDKYTGEVYTFYQGQTFEYKLFDPQSEGALAFAG